MPVIGAFGDANPFGVALMALEYPPMSLDLRAMLDDRQSVLSTVSRRWSESGVLPEPNEVTLFVLSSHQELWTAHVVAAAVALSGNRPESVVMGELAGGDEAALSELSRILRSADVSVDTQRLPHLARTLLTVLSASALDYIGSSAACIAACGRYHVRDSEEYDRCVLGCGIS